MRIAYAVSGMLLVACSVTVTAGGEDAGATASDAGSDTTPGDVDAGLPKVPSKECDGNEWAWLCYGYDKTRGAWGVVDTCKTTPWKKPDGGELVYRPNGQDYCHRFDQGGVICCPDYP